MFVPSVFLSLFVSLTPPLSAHEPGCGDRLRAEPDPLAAEMLKYYQGRNASGALNGLDGVPTVVTRADDGLIVRSAGDLWLVRRVKLNAAFESERLRGDEVDRAERVGAFFLIRTRDRRGGRRYLHVIPEHLRRTELIHEYSAADVDREVTPPRGVGRVVQIGGVILMVFTDDRPTAADAERGRFSRYQANGVVEALSFPPDLADVPLVAVEYRAKPAYLNPFLLDRAYRSRRLLLDYSGALGQADARNRVAGTPIMVIDVPRDSQLKAFTNLGLSPDDRLTHVFINSPDRRKPTTVATWDYRAADGFARPRMYYPAQRVDLATLTRAAVNSGFITYRFTGRATRGPADDKPFDLVMAAPAKELDANFPLLLPRAQVAYADELAGATLIESDARRDQTKVTSSTLEYRYVYLSTLGHQNTSFAFDSTLPLERVSRQFPVRVETFGTTAAKRRFPLLFARARGADNPGYFVINVDTADVLWMPGLNRIQIVETGLYDKVLFWGEQTRGDKVVPLLAAWNLGARKMEFGWPVDDSRGRESTLHHLGRPPHYKADVLREKLRYLNQPDNALVSPGKAPAAARFYKGRPLGTWIERAGVDVRYHHALKSLVVGLREAGGRREFAYLFDVEDFTPRIFGQVFRPQVDAGEADDALVLVGGAHQWGFDAKDVIDGVPFLPAFWREPVVKRRRSRRYDVSWVSVVQRSPDGTLVRQTAAVTGHVERLRLMRHGGNTYAVGQARVGGFTRDRAADFRWNLAETRVAEHLISKVERPLYEDDEFSVVVTRRSPDQHPKVRLYAKDEIIGTPIELTRAKAPNETRGSVQSLFDFLTEVAGKNEPVHNTENVVEARREGDLLFLTTERTAEHGAETYVYNLRRKQIDVIIPNYRRHVDLGALRFYVGEADHTFPTIVAVFRRQTNTFETFFDFGTVKIDADRDAIRARGSQVIFRTSTGSERVYETRGKHFLGLLPPAITDILKDLNGKLGFVWNTKLFRQSLPRVFERDDVLASLREAFPLRHGRDGARFLMLVVPEGAGATALLETFFSHYITGNLAAAFKPVFFKLNATDSQSGTMFRGTKADKYKALRETGLALRPTGYRLIVGAEGVHRLLPAGQEVFADEEGDFFSALREVMEDGEFDVIATTTPGGLEQLQRRKPEFANMFKHVLRIPPLTKAQTERAIAGYLSEEFGTAPVMNGAQVKKVVERAARLSIGRTLPGAAFDVIKRIVPTPPENAKRAFKPAAVEDAAIDREISQRSGVPPILLDREHAAENAQRMRAYLNGRVRGVPEIVDQFVGDLFAFALEMNRPDWPIMRLFAMGPTGTGKSELIKAALDFLMGDHQARLLISGENWGAPGQAHKLGAMIIAHVIRYPFNVLQFDEFEKMHPENQNALLSLADGEVTGPDGNKVSTSLSIIYATSNLGVDDVKREVASRSYGFRDEGDLSDLNANLGDVYERAQLRELRPEVVNRFDRTLTFPFLVADVAAAVAESYLNGYSADDKHALRRRLLDRGYDVRFSPEVIAHVARNFVKFELGARRLAINIENAVTKEFLGGEIMAGRLRAGVGYEVKVQADHFELAPYRGSDER